MYCFFETEFTTNLNKNMRIRLYKKWQISWPHATYIYGAEEECKENAYSYKKLVHSYNSEIIDNELTDERAAYWIDRYLSYNIFDCTDPRPRCCLNREIIEKRRYNGNPFSMLPLDHPVRKELGNEPYGDRKSVV